MFFTVEKLQVLLDDLRAAIHRGAQSIPTFKFFEGDVAGAERGEFDDSGWKDFAVGEDWGGYDMVAWFRARVPVPREWRNKKLALSFLVGPRDGGGSTAETMLYVNSIPLQAIGIWHPEAWLPPELIQDEIMIALKAWSSVLNVPKQRNFRVAELVCIEETTAHLYYTANTLLRAVRVLDANDLCRVQLLQLLDDAFHQIDFTQLKSEMFYETVASAAAFLDARLAELEQVQEIKPTVTAIGHSHLDVAWLWRLAHTREKAARTFATALHLMRQYPEYRYLHSSPALYEYLQTDYPELFARVKERITAGAWEIAGGMWVEADTNLPSGESLVRQILFGTRYMRDEFGKATKLVWLPDSFGFSYALPQILKKSGLEFFMTTKLSWNQFNRFPYDTFRWRGTDGSEVLAHLVTTPEEGTRRFTYIGRVEPADIQGLWNNYNQKEINDELLLIYGWGDGGGGPDQEMLEAARVLKNVPGIPYVKLDSAEAFFERLGTRLADKNVPVWAGELYLELHRGVSTTQAWLKRANRRAEWVYHDAEWLNALADVLTRSDAYPAKALQRGWKLLLLNQFHDILAGTLIAPAIEDARVQYSEIQQIGESAASNAQERIARNVPAATKRVLVFNSLGFAQTDWVEVEDEGANRLVLCENVPAFGYTSFPLDGQTSPANTFAITPTHLENSFWRIELNAHGQIVSLFDHRNERDVLAPNAHGNVLQAFQDKAMRGDAWEVEIYFQDKVTEVTDLVEAVVEEQGPLRGVLRLAWRFYDSTITQWLTLYAHSPRIDFRTRVDWHERQLMLKAAFPVNVRATFTTYDIQFGTIARPNHWNTSWDYARFEVVAHKWADLSEGTYGVALLNDCKYGYDVRDNVLRLTLLRSPTYPDPNADLGDHTFTYALLPHTGDWREGGVMQEAYALNAPLRARIIDAQAGTLPDRYSFVSSDSENVLIETVKKAEEGDAWVVRVYEYKQQRGYASLTLGKEICKAVECDLMERNETVVTFERNHLRFFIAPYEIKTFKVWL